MATASAYEWVNTMVAAQSRAPLATDVIWKSLDQYAGRDANSDARLKEVLDCINGELATDTDGPLPGLWVRVADYLRLRQMRATSFARES